MQAWVSDTSHLVLIAGGLSALASFLAVAALATNDFRAARASDMAHAAMLARILEDQATRTVETVELALEALATSPALESADPRRMEELLSQALMGHSYLRGLAVVDAAGRVMASTQAGDADAVVDMARLGGPATVGRSTLGGWTPGRSLQGVRLQGASTQAPAGVAFVPMLYGFKNGAGSERVLVALLNPDALSNFQLLTLETDSFDSVVASYDGQILATSGAAAQFLGTRVNHRLPVFMQYLPRQEHATYLGAGVLGGIRSLASGHLGPSHWW